MKKFVSLFMVIALVLCCSYNVFAIEYENIINVKVEDYNKFEGLYRAPIANLPVITVPENATEEEKIQAVNDYIESEIEPQAVEFALYTLVIRSGTSTACELYFQWTGIHIISGLSFTNMKIQSTSLLNPTVYSNIGGSAIPCTPAATAGTAKILDINVPTDVTRVRAVVTAPMMRTISEGWVSLTSINSTVTIN